MQKWNKNPVLVGFMAIISGIAFGYFYVYRKLRLAAEGVDNLYYSFKLAGLVPIMIIMGLFYLLFRPGTGLAPADMKPKIKLFYWIFVVIAFVAGLFVAVSFKNHLQAMGYIQA